MYLISFLPISICVNGVSFNRYIEFDSRDGRKYVKELQRMTLEIMDISNCESRADKLKCVQSIRQSLLRVNEFWFEKIFSPLSNEYDLPDDSACRCLHGQCRFDFFRCSHFEVNGAKVKVDIFSRAPAISVNCAIQSQTDIERLKDYYALTMKRFEAMPCCNCAPLSKRLVSILETVIMFTRATLDKVIETVDEVDNIVVV